jgi:hypothetical protein
MLLVFSLSASFSTQLTKSGAWGGDTKAAEAVGTFLRFLMPVY